MERLRGPEGRAVGDEAVARFDGNANTLSGVADAAPMK